MAFVPHQLDGTKCDDCGGIHTPKQHRVDEGPHTAYAIAQNATAIVEAFALAVLALRIPALRRKINMIFQNSQRTQHEGELVEAPTEADHMFFSPAAPNSAVFFETKDGMVGIPELKPACSRWTDAHTSFKKKQLWYQRSAEAQIVCSMTFEGKDVYLVKAFSYAYYSGLEKTKYPTSPTRYFAIYRTAALASPDPNTWTTLPLAFNIILTHFSDSGTKGTPRQPPAELAATYSALREAAQQAVQPYPLSWGEAARLRAGAGAPIAKPVMRPDPPKYVAPAPAAPAGGEKKKKKGAKRADRSLSASASAAAPGMGGTQASPGPVKRGRGRPPGSKNMKTQAAETAVEGSSSGRGRGNSRRASDAPAPARDGTVDAAVNRHSGQGGKRRKGADGAAVASSSHPSGYATPARGAPALGGRVPGTARASPGGQQQQGLAAAASPSNGGEGVAVADDSATAAAAGAGAGVSTGAGVGARCLADQVEEFEVEGMPLLSVTDVDHASSILSAYMSSLGCGSGSTPSLATVTRASSRTRTATAKVKAMGTSESRSKGKSGSKRQRQAEENEDNVEGEGEQPRVIRDGGAQEADSRSSQERRDFMSEALGAWYPGQDSEKGRVHMALLRRERDRFVQSLFDTQYEGAGASLGASLGATEDEVQGTGSQSPSFTWSSLPSAPSCTASGGAGAGSAPKVLSPAPIGKAGGASLGAYSGEEEGGAATHTFSGGVEGMDEDVARSYRLVPAQMQMQGKGAAAPPRLTGYKRRKASFEAEEVEEDESLLQQFPPSPGVYDALRLAPLPLVGGRAPLSPPRVPFHAVAQAEVPEEE